MPSSRRSPLIQSLFTALLLSLASTLAGAAEHQTNGYSFSVEPRPGWVEWTALPGAADARPGQAVAYRLVDRQVYVEAAGETRFTRLVSEPLTEAGLQQAAQIEIDFNPAFQRLSLHALDLVREGRTHSRLQADDVRLIQREQDFENKLYDGIVTAVIIIDDVRLHDSIDLAYSIEGRNPVFGNKHFSAFAMGWEVPVDLAQVRVSAPRARKLHYRVFNGDMQAEINRKDARTEYRWSARNTPAVFTEDSAPTWHQPYPAIQLSEYRRWREVADWAASLYRHDAPLPPALERTLAQWRDETQDKKELAARALRLVQDQVRYFGIELGQNSHRPSLPGEVYARRYGDCKDKTALLVAMLEALDIEAYPALVATDYQRDIDNWLPSPGPFDHVIVTTRIDGTRYWLDGTRTYQQGTIDTLGMPDFERALIVRRGERSLTPIEINDTAASGIEIEEEFEMSDYEGSVTLAVKTTYSGAHAEAMREQFATNSPEAITRSYINYYAKLYPAITALGQVESYNSAGDNRFTTVERYRVENFWEPDTDGRYAFLVGSAIAPFVKKPDAIHRTTPLALSHPVRIRQRSTLIYPEDIDYQVDTPHITVEDRFVHYQRDVSYSARRLTVTHQYQSREDAIMPAQLDDYFSDLNKIKDNLKYATWLGDAPAKRTVGSMVDTLLNRLETVSSH